MSCIRNDYVMVHVVVLLCINYMILIISGSSQHLSVVMDMDGKPHVNVDLFHSPGIDRAASLELAANKLANVFVTPHLYYGVRNLLDKDRYIGRAFTLIRDPVEAQLSACECQSLLFDYFSFISTQYALIKLHNQNSPYRNN